MFYPQGNFNSQGNLGVPQGSFGQQGLQGSANGNGVPFANTLYGYPQFAPVFQGGPQSGWQHPGLQQAQLQAALQQQAMLQPLAPQFAAPPFAFQNSLGTNALTGVTNGTAQSVAGWQQPQVVPEQINPALQQQSQQNLLQRLAQYQHLLAQYQYLVAQQTAQIVAQQTAQNTGYNYSGQFMPGQLGANFVPGVTTH